MVRIMNYKLSTSLYCFRSRGAKEPAGKSTLLACMLEAENPLLQTLTLNSAIFQKARLRVWAHNAGHALITRAGCRKPGRQRRLAPARRAAQRTAAWARARTRPAARPSRRQPGRRSRPGRPPGPGSPAAMDQKVSAPLAGAPRLQRVAPLMEPLQEGQPGCCKQDSRHCVVCSLVTGVQRAKSASGQHMGRGIALQPLVDTARQCYAAVRQSP